MSEQRIYLIVRNFSIGKREIVDMITIVDDTSVERGLLNASTNEQNRLRTKYPECRYEIIEEFADQYPPYTEEGHFIASHKIEERLASKCLIDCPQTRN